MGDGDSDAALSHVTDAVAAPAATFPILGGVGIGAGVAGLILFVVVCILIQYLVHRRRSRLALKELENGPRQLLGGNPMVQRLGLPVPFGPTHHWHALSSDDSLRRLSDKSVGQQPGISAFAFTANNHPANNVSPRSKLVRLGYATAINGQRFKALSAIIESPQSSRKTWNTMSPVHHSIRPVYASPKTSSPLIRKSRSDSSDSPRGSPKAADSSIFTPWTTLSLKKQRLNDIEQIPTRPNASRSRSEGVLPVSLTESILHDDNHVPRPAMAHLRSISYGAAAVGPPPMGPLPPLPKVVQKETFNKEGTPEITEIILPQGRLAHSLEDREDGFTEQYSMVDDTSRLTDRDHTYIKRRHNNFSLPRNPDSAQTETNYKRNSSQSDHTGRPHTIRKSARDGLDMHRLSAVGSLKSGSSQKRHSTSMSTPRCRSSIQISSTGSPIKSSKSYALQQLSTNMPGHPSRQPSPTDRSSGSTITDSFYWDISPQKMPSAMKGSPTAKKGHKRQNCVRISTLAPEVLGPPSRSISPTLEEILEESPGGSSVCTQAVSTHQAPILRPTRPRLATESGADPVKLRASLTPSSPTLSLSRFGQEFRFPTNTSYGHDDISNMSTMSSPINIPPLRNSHDILTRRNIPPPTIELTRPSCDTIRLSGNDDDSLFDAFLTPQETIDDYQNIMIDNDDQEYDPAWHPLVEGLAHDANLYDPSRPTEVHPLPSSSSPPSPLDSQDIDMDCFEHIEVAYAPTNPRFFFDDYSTNIAPQVSSPTVILKSSPPPLLLVPAEDLPLPPSSANSTPLSVPSPLRSNPPTRSRPAPQPDLSEFMPEPLYSNRSSQTPSQSQRTGHPSLLGPRQAPAKDLRKSIMQLRRMNSDIRMSFDSASGCGRRYLKLGREASPILPFDGTSPADRNFDFDFGVENVDPLHSETKRNERGSTVWEDGEAYWDRPSAASTPSRETRKKWRDVTFVGVPQTPVKRWTPSLGTVDAKGKVRDSPFGLTPRSLYDADGFLRGEDKR